MLRMMNTFCDLWRWRQRQINANSRIAQKRKTLATVTAVQPPGRFGAIKYDQKVTGFMEKPQGDGGMRINGGFFVLSPKIAGYIDGDSSIWEREPMENLGEG